MSRQVLLDAFQAAVAAARPEAAVRAAVQSIARPRGRTVVVGGGKAASGMARAFEQAWAEHNGDAPLKGVVVTPYGHALERPRTTLLLEAGHPLPDAASEAAGERMLTAVRGLGPDDLVVALLSGGGSALMVAPDGVNLAEKLRVTGLLLHSGADIGEINTVRKQLSRLKGGRLALAAAPARVVSLIVSDVVGDDLSTIASGPTVPDYSTPGEALAVLERYAISSPAAQKHLLAQAGRPPAQLADGEAHLIVTNRLALQAARAELQQAGYVARIWSDSVTGESREAARLHAVQARALQPGEALLSGGETTVTVRGGGRGGRNCEFLLALAVALGPGAGLYALACDSDGIDGASSDGANPAAGALLTPDTLLRAERLGLNAQAMLDDNDAAGFFAALGDLVVVGPTGTNVNDVRVILRPRG